MVHPKETYIPNPAMVKEYETRFEEYKRIYPGLKDISLGYPAVHLYTNSVS